MTATQKIQKLQSEVVIRSVGSTNRPLLQPSCLEVGAEMLDVGAGALMREVVGYILQGLRWTDVCSEPCDGALPSGGGEPICSDIPEPIFLTRTGMLLAGECGVGCCW